MKKPLTIEEKQGVLMDALLEGELKNPKGYAIFGIEKEVVKPLIKKGWLHHDTWKYIRGATLTQAGRAMLEEKRGAVKFV